MKTKPALLFTVLLLPYVSYGSGLTVRVAPDLRSVTVDGAVSVSDFSWNQSRGNLPDPSAEPRWKRRVVLVQRLGTGQLAYFRDRALPYCPDRFDCATEPSAPASDSSKWGWSGRTDCPSYPQADMSMRAKVVDWINAQNTAGDAIPVNETSLTPGGTPATVSSAMWACMITAPPIHPYTGITFVYFTLSSPNEVSVVDPTVDPSVCSLNDIPNIQFSSVSKNVSGIKKSATVLVSCSPGNPQHYSLRLTGSSDASGRLLFDSGVSADITINGVSLPANGSARLFPVLTSTNLDLGAELVGTAREAGVSRATGVLILENL